MKKVVFILLTLCLCVATFAACDKGDEPTDTTADTIAATQAETEAEQGAETAAETLAESQTDADIDAVTDAVTEAMTDAATEAETQPYVMDTTVADRVYTYVARRGFIAVSVNNEGKPLAVNTVDSDDMSIEERSQNWCPITTFAYAEDGKMTAVTMDGNEVAVTAWDELGRPTAVAENDAGISLAYDDNGGLTLTRGEQIWVFDGYCRCLKYEESPDEVSLMTFGDDGNSAKAVFVGNDRYEYLITYEDHTHLVTVDEYDSEGTDFIFNFKWTEKGLCAEFTFTELDEEAGQAERVLQEASRCVFTYDEAGRVTKYAEYYENFYRGTPERLECEESYTYNQAGLVVGGETKYYESGELATRYVYAMTYNDKGQNVSATRTAYDRKGNLTGTRITVVEYKENGKDYTRTTTDYDAGNVKTQEMIAEVTYQTETSGTSHEITIVYENGEEVSRSEADFGFSEE